MWLRGQHCGAINGVGISTMLHITQVNQLIPTNHEPCSHRRRHHRPRGRACGVGPCAGCGRAAVDEICTVGRGAGERGGLQRGRLHRAQAQLRDRRRALVSLNNHNRYGWSRQSRSGPTGRGEEGVVYITINVLSMKNMTDRITGYSDY